MPVVLELLPNARPESLRTLGPFGCRLLFRASPGKDPLHDVIVPFVTRCADLLLVNGNPLDNLTTLEHPNGVMVRGKWLPRPTIDELLKRLGDGE